MSNENSSAEVLKTPEEWCQIEGVQILDADGWRGRGGRDWNDPITRAEFQERLITCTQRSVVPRPETCRPVEVDGETIRVHGAGEASLARRKAEAALKRAGGGE
jgi:hypothetical protein